ncbi:MAG: hypothetical protein AAGN66_17060 [Acidobacteriota bacterium]
MGQERELKRLRGFLRRVRRGRPERGGDGAYVERRRRLGVFQCTRLKTTHGDLLADTRYRPAVEFFFDELYVTRDITGRDLDLERMAPLMVRTLPRRMLDTLCLALEMEALSQDLDARLLGHLDPAAAGTLDRRGWLEAYRRCDDYGDRRRQVDLIGLIGGRLDKVVRRRGLGMALRMARHPAHLSGFGEIHDLLERGYRAFRHMRGAETFLKRIVDREHRIIEQIRGGNPDPLEVQ